MGIVGFELMAAITIAIVFQRKLTYRRWHFIHWLAYPAFILSLAHTVATAAEARKGLPEISAELRQPLRVCPGDSALFKVNIPTRKQFFDKMRWKLRFDVAYCRAPRG